MTPSARAAEPKWRNLKGSGYAANWPTTGVIYPVPPKAGTFTVSSGRTSIDPGPAEGVRSRCPQMPPPAAARDTKVLDNILALQLLVAWAGEGRSEPKRFGWWDTDLVDEAGGADLLARLAPRTHVWSSLELVREAARRVDAKARGKHGDPDKLRSLFFLGFELDEKVSDRLAELKRAGKAPEEVLPLPLRLNADFTPNKVTEVLTKLGKVAFDKVPPVGRQLKGVAPNSPEAMVQNLAAALVPVVEVYPLPFYKVEG